MKITPNSTIGYQIWSLLHRQKYTVIGDVQLADSILSAWFRSDTIMVYMQLGIGFAEGSYTIQCVTPIRELGQWEYRTDTII